MKPSAPGLPGFDSAPELPPTNAERERTDIDAVKRAQAIWCDGFRARQRKQVMKTVRTKRNGEEIKAVDQKASVPPDRCPEERAEDAVQWEAGWRFADRVAVARGQAYLETRDPTKPVPSLERPEQVAEPVELFPEAITSRAAGRRILRPHLYARTTPTTADEQE